MWKFAVGLLCVGTMTLGVALTRGQEGAPGSEDELAPAALDQATDGLAEIVQAVADAVEIEIGADAGIVAGGEDVDQEIVVLSDDGKVIEQRRFPGARLRLSRLDGRQILDAATREAIEKIVAGLKDDAKRLSGEGKNEESNQKLRSAEALGQLLNQPAAVARVRPQVKRIQARVVNENKAAAAKLKTAAKQLAEQAAKLKQEGKLDEASKLEGELAELKTKIGRVREQMHAFALPGLPQMPGQPGIPPFGPQGFGPGQPGGGFPGPHAWGQPGFQGHGFGFGSFGSPEADALTHKAEALSQAAAKLKEAGLEDQSKQIAKQAEEIKAKAEAARAQAAQAAGGPAGFPPGPHAGELQRSIRELHEQVQLLRKEVGELRELLQKRQ